METPFLLPSRDARLGSRVVHLVPTAPPLVPVLSAEEDVSPDVDRVLTMVAHEARTGDLSARNALFAACAPKIERFVRRYRAIGSASGPWTTLEVEDVRQEAFLVFADLIGSWHGGESFCVYFLGQFPWHLRNAVRRLAVVNRAFIGWQTVPGLYLLADGSAAAAEAQALLQTVAEQLPAPDGSILLWRIRDVESFGTIARRLGTSRRTVMRAWDRLAIELRRSLTP
jgi:RNA polymerase sigma factor (sigma-70 family)